MRSVVGGLFLLLAGCHSVTPPETPQYDRYEQQIIFHADPENYHKTGEHGAVAKYVDQNPFVFYNPEWFSSMPQEMQTFFFQHEVAHFRLKHVKREPYFVTEKQKMLMEMQADCHSMIYLRNKLHYSADQFETIFEFADFQLEWYRAADLGNCLRKK
ncbi:MAG TPA: hypothetical protein VJA18_02235 [Candidatus Nanoarchaeia archaeon]|nr:hypothetical protein [Candidatus Nanoarchaeia archaeon]